MIDRTSAIMEHIPDTLSLEKLRKESSLTLPEFYQTYFQDNFKEAQTNFIKSLAGYSVFCYLMNVKDRHEGNFLIDRSGHIMMVNFEYMLQS